MSTAATTARRIRNPLAKLDAATARELAREYLAGSVAPRERLDAPARVADACADIGAEPVEHIVAFALDSRLGLLQRVTIAKGGVNAVAFAPRDLFRALLAVDGAASFIMAHNHPTGDPTPSAEDWELTRRVAEGARLLGLPLCDHVVVTRDPSRFASMRSLGGTVQW